MSIEHKVAVAVLLDFRKNDHGEVLVTYRGSSHDIHVVTAIPFLRVVNMELVLIENQVPPKAYPDFDLMTDEFEVITQGDDEVGVPVICKEAVVLFMKSLIEEIEDGISITYGVLPSRPGKQTRQIPHQISEEREKKIKKDIEFLSRELSDLQLCDPLEYQPFPRGVGYEEMGFWTENNELDPDSEEGHKYRKKAHMGNMERLRKDIEEESEDLRVLLKTRESFLLLDRGESVPAESVAKSETVDQMKPIESSSETPSPNSLRRAGEIWLIRFQGKQSFWLPDSMGLFYLSALIKNQGQELSVNMLSELASKGTFEPRKTGDIGHSGEGHDLKILTQPDRGIRALEPETIREYEMAIRDLIEEKREAVEMNDPGRAESLGEKIEMLLEEHRKGQGFRGGEKLINDKGESIRKRVSNAVSRAIKLIGKHDKELRNHLLKHCRGGYHFLYAPEDPITWEL